MSKENNPESVFDIDKLLIEFTNALTGASVNLYRTFQEDADKKNLPYSYHIPKMSISINVALSYSKGKIKGFFKKTKAEETSALESQLSLDVVAIPKVAK